jgi:hypothetical protein
VDLYSLSVLSPDVPSRMRSLSQSAWPVQSLGEMLFLPPQEIARLPVGFTNLLCATNLPDTANLNLTQCFHTLILWVDNVRSATERQLFRFHQHPSEYQNSEAYFRVLVLITVLQRDLGVTYHPNLKDATERNLSHQTSRELFLHGLLDGDKLGTCANMPVLYAAVGRMLNYPIYLVRAAGHVFCRWHDNSTGERFNIEGSGRGLNTHPDSYYQSWPQPLSPLEVQNGVFLRNLDPAEELSLFMSLRGQFLEDTGYLHEAITSHAHALQLAPADPVAQSYLINATQRERDLKQTGQLPRSYFQAEEQNAKAGKQLHRFVLKGLGVPNTKGVSR